ncbi:YolD-like family protein [Fictibacillus sp. KU28468]|uniref:YolD-like family protein n=1 Tax=Fictibacillus sp. KU28468 TaxID=2991053 RepID=UPI00223D1B5D|nr:YolD-like family protein [Fictibacillus sp. KU28468]UZJ80564.1 YolD-like family protein [Fictibacillus sp. KU28468]
MNILRDRGKMKWQGMFMPEHVKSLREFDWDNKRKTKPELDEQQLEVMEETICEAMAENLDLCFTYYRGGDFRLLIGKVHYIDPYRKELRIVDFHNEVHKVVFTDLVDVKVNRN